MKKIFLFLSLIFALSISTFAQTDLSLWGGYSWLNGVVGAEAQFGKFAVSGGYYPAKMPGSGDRISSFSAAVTFYGKDNEFLDNHSGALGACYYGSVGFASAGYRAETSYNGGAWTDDVVEPVTILMLGVKSYASKWSFKLGAGYGFYEGGSTFTWEIGFGYALFSSHSW
jgi:hypothetical protein